MACYRAEIVSSNRAIPVSAVIEFESEHRVGSKQNIQDARYKMLELHGAEALSWMVRRVERVAGRSAQPTEQLFLDFREPEKPRCCRSVKRGFAGT